jgi:hypothetical protein
MYVYMMYVGVCAWIWRAAFMHACKRENSYVCIYTCVYVCVCAWIAKVQSHLDRDLAVTAKVQSHLDRDLAVTCGSHVSAAMLNHVCAHAS